MKTDSKELLEEIEKERNSIKTDKIQMSFGEIMSMYEKNELVVNPLFKQKLLWTDIQKTKFIESLIIGIPVPSVIVIENKSGRWELIDGYQRLATLFSFFGILKNISEQNNWKLGECNLIKTLNNYSCEDLPFKIQLNIKRTICLLQIINCDADLDLQTELFSRYNMSKI